jgi:hypothetical protein
LERNVDLFSCQAGTFPKVAAVLAIFYGIFVIQGLWRKRFVGKNSGSNELSTMGKIHIILWTIGPPTWFFVEYWVASKYVCPGDESALNQIKLWQDIAKNFWAGLLAAMLFLKGK